MRYFITFSYDGTDFHGSQRQPNGITVQEVMEDAFQVLLQQEITLTFAGRTDAGVHAEMMVAHFDAENLPNNFLSRLNNFLPATIAVSSIVPVTDDAHARFDAISRRYEYRITAHKDVFARCYTTRVPDNLDFERMNEAAKLLLGQQDFASFCRVHTDVKTTICNVTRAEWSNGIFTIEADRFLRNMVRAVVGTLFEVGKGKMTISQFKDVISKHHRTAAGQSAPAQGLFLVNISYPESIFTK